MSRWDTCEHEWEEVDDDLCPPQCTSVECKKCEVPGQRNDNTGEVFWPAT